MKIEWMQNYLKMQNKGKWKSVIDRYLKGHGGKVVFRNNLKRQDVSQLGIGEPFVTEVNVKGQNQNSNWWPICLNSLMRIENRPIFYRTWFNAGVKVIRDLVGERGNFLSYNAS